MCWRWTWETVTGKRPTLFLLLHTSIFLLPFSPISSLWTLISHLGLYLSVPASCWSLACSSYPSRPPDPWPCTLSPPLVTRTSPAQPHLGYGAHLRMYGHQSNWCWPAKTQHLPASRALPLSSGRESWWIISFWWMIHHAIFSSLPG